MSRTTLAGKAKAAVIAGAAMVELYRQGHVTKTDLTQALKKYDIDGNKPNPRLV